MPHIRSVRPATEITTTAMRAMGYRSKPSHAGFFRLLLVAAQNSDDDAACTALSKIIGQRGRLTRLLKMLF